MTHDKDSEKKPHTERKPKLRPAGPHDRPDLTDNEKTPGSGMLPDGEKENIQPSS